ncbi:MAG: hypothetical protein P8184_18755, partial [Calditrichia bacterium]
MVWKIILMILLPLSAFSKTSVDSLTAELELLSESPVEGWKYTINYPFDDGAVSEASDPEFDDTFWELLGFGHRLTADSCWMRCEFDLPEKIMGQQVRGLVKLSVSVDDYGYMWINGESKGRFPWDGDFILTENGSPGMKFVILIKAMNTGGPM